MSKLFENSYYSVLSKIVHVLISIFSGMIIAKNLGPEGKGSYFLVTQIVSIGAIIISMGIGPSILYYLKKNKLTKDEAISISIFYSLIVSSFLFILFFFFKTTFIQSFNNTISELMLLFVILLIIINLIINFFGYIIMNKDTGVKIWSIFSAFVNISYLTLLFFLVYNFSGGVMGAIYSLFVSVLIKLLFCIKYIFTEKVFFNIVSLKRIKKILKYGLGIFIGNLFITGVYRIDIFFVNSLLSVSDLGLYSVSVNLSEFLLLIPSSIGVALFPHLSSQESKDRIETMSKIARLTSVLSLFASLGIILFARPFILIIFGEAFISSYIPTLLLLPGLVAMTLNFAYSNYLFSVGKPYLSAKIFLIGIVINIILNILFLKDTGILGAAIFSSISYFVITLGFIIVILKENKGIKIIDIIIPNKQDYNYLILKLKTIIKSF